MHVINFVTFSLFYLIILVSQIQRSQISPRSIVQFMSLIIRVSNSSAFSNTAVVINDCSANWATSVHINYTSWNCISYSQAIEMAEILCLVRRENHIKNILEASISALLSVLLCELRSQKASPVAPLHVRIHFWNKKMFEILFLDGNSRVFNGLNNITWTRHEWVSWLWGVAIKNQYTINLVTQVT